jgi:hypothetical protein
LPYSPYLLCAWKAYQCSLSWVRILTRDRCYDFLNIFAEKFSEKIGVFNSKQS